jgi:hypothetical protein
MVKKMDLLQIAEIKAIRGTTELQTNKLQKHPQKNLTDVILLVCDSSGLALLSKFQLELLHLPCKVAHVVSNNC